MFGSKSKQQKSQAKISIETMEGNLKGEGEKTATIEYNNVNPIKAGESVSSESSMPPVVEQKSTVKDMSSQQEPFKSPFNGGDLPIGEPGSAEKSKVGQGSFPSAVDTLSTAIPKQEDSAFLQQAIDNKENDENETINAQTEKNLEIKKSGTSSFLFIILFIVLLAGIILGGYYFYMHKESATPNTQQKTKTEKQQSTQVQKTTGKVETADQQTAQKKTEPAVVKIEKLITSTGTFNDDIAKFVLDLKNRRSTIELQNGIFISPMTTTEQALTAKGLLESLHMVAFFKQTDLKDSCKLFAIEDSGEIKLAIIFELTETADEKLIKDSIMQKEKDLMAKMRYLFVDGVKPIVPVEVIFAINNANMQARYDNYIPEVDTTSVDWNILDLGKGKIVYFATSRKTAKTLTDYFVRTVTK